MTSSMQYGTHRHRQTTVLKGLGMGLGTQQQGQRCVWLVCYTYLLLVYRKVIDTKSLKQRGKGQKGGSSVGVGGDRGYLH